MAFGKGSFTAQDKILPGMYVNIKGETDVGSDIGVRGKVAVALELDWAKDAGKIFKVTAQEFYKDSKKIFGYDYRDDAMKTLREIFKGATEVYIYRLNGTDAVAASAAEFAVAKCAGVRGDALKVSVTNSVEGGYDVVTSLDGEVVDKQINVTTETLKGNDFVTFLDGIALEVGDKLLEGGKNGTTVSKSDHVAFLTELESYQVNIVGYIGTDTEIATLYTRWVINQRDVYGNYMQGVLSNAANHEGIINVDDIAMIPWVMGKSAGCALNASLQNVIYDGEVTPTKTYTQADLEAALTAGKFVLHRVGDGFRVLADINSLVTIGGIKTDDYKYNQTIRVVDQIIFDGSQIWVNYFLGKVPSNEPGRLSFWSRIISMLNEYVGIGAIEEYDKNLVTVAEGTQRGSVVMTIPVQVATMLEKAYVTIMVQ